MKRTCIFVDGENFRHSLRDLFHEDKYTFSQLTTDETVRQALNIEPIVSRAA